MRRTGRARRVWLPGTGSFGGEPLMSAKMTKMLHTLGALADLGSEITSAHDFEEMMRASLYTLLGTLAIRKGAVTRHSSRPRQLKVIAAKGLPSAVGVRIELGKDETERLAARSRPLDLTDVAPAASLLSSLSHSPRDNTSRSPEVRGRFHISSGETARCLAAWARRSRP